MGPKSKDGVRQRKKAENSNADGDAKPTTKPAAKPAAKPTPPPSSPSSPAASAGMTCMNWFIVLFFICGVSGGMSFFIYNEMTLTNRAVLDELHRIREKSSDNSGFERQIKDITKKLDVIKQLQEELANVKKNEAARADDFGNLGNRIKKSQTMFADLTAQFGASLQNIENMQTQMEAMKTTQSQVKESKETELALKKINDLLEVSNTNVAYLSDEVLRLDKRFKESFEQTSSIQKEVIDLTADKVAMNSAIESIKSTIVAVRESVEKFQTQTPGDVRSFEETIQKLDTKVMGEIERVSRQILETSENSAKWLQQSTNEMNGKFQRSIEDLSKQFSDVKVKVEEPTRATADESLLNSIASLDTRLSEMSKDLDKVNTLIGEVSGKQKESELAVSDEAEMVQSDIASLTTRVLEVASRDNKLMTAFDEITKEVTTLSNELNGIRSIARILETRIEEMKTEDTNNKAEEPAQSEKKESPKP